MNAPHSPGPITFKADGEANRYAMFTGDGYWLLTVLHNGVMLSETQEANFRRMAACWNACEGLSTRTIEIMAQLGGVTSKMPVVAKLAAERDELLEALRHIEGSAMDITCERRTIRDAARAAIDKAEGKA